MAWTIAPGRPFWSGTVVFFTSMGSLISMDALSLTAVDVQVSWLGALVVSVVVSGAAYAKAKLDELTPPKD